MKWENSLKDITIKAHSKRAGNLNSPLCTEEIKFVTYNFPTKNTPK